MKKINTVKKNKEFTNIIKNGIYFKTKYFSLYKYNNNLNIYRIGISVGKKNGNAVIRNKIKRQLRNIADKYKNNYSKGEDYIIIVKKDYSVSFFNEINKDFGEAIIRINKRRSKTNEKTK